MLVVPKNNIYGVWAGNPKGSTEDKSKCVVEVRTKFGGLFKQCGRKRGFGPNGEYCKQHARMAMEEKHA